MVRAEFDAWVQSVDRRLREATCSAEGALGASSDEEAQPCSGILFNLCTVGTHIKIWPPNSNLANLVIYGLFIKKSTFWDINGYPKQCILVDTMFNYRFHFGLPGKCLQTSPGNTPFWRRVCFEDLSKDILLEVQNETCS